ncbi:MAG: hypothetical protein ACR2QJ_05590 [Geminicoccaceae bacterium]
MNEWRDATEQLKVGQALLRGDRDELLQKIREREVSLSTLEASHEQAQTRLQGVEAQRKRLQGDVLKLTQEIAQSERSTESAASDGGQTVALKRLRRERDRLELELAGQRTDKSRLDKALEESRVQIETLTQERTDLDALNASVALDVERLGRELAERRETERQHQIVRGHHASLGQVRPYIAEVGPEEWRVIESWLAQQLRRPMAVPDLSVHGWSYEGARLLGVIDGPPMTMLLYADEQDRPVSLTIARDASGERPLEISESGGLDLLDWREERHAFFLIGGAGDDVLEAVALDLQNHPPALKEDAPVPVSRYIRPTFRPVDWP